MATILIDKLLQTVVNRKASDLHITVGQPPVLRIDGILQRLDTKTLEPTDTLSLSNRDLYKVSKLDMKTYALLVMNLAREISRRLRHMDELIAGPPPGNEPPAV